MQQEKVVQAGALAPVLSMLRGGVSRQRQVAAHALAALLREPSGQVASELLAAPHAVQDLLQLLQQGPADSRYCAAICLTHLTVTQQCTDSWAADQVSCPSQHF